MFCCRRSFDRRSPYAAATEALRVGCGTLLNDEGQLLLRRRTRLKPGLKLERLFAMIVVSVLSGVIALVGLEEPARNFSRNACSQMEDISVPKWGTPSLP